MGCSWIHSTRGHLIDSLRVQALDSWTGRRLLRTPKEIMDLTAIGYLSVVLALVRRRRNLIWYVDRRSLSGPELILTERARIFSRFEWNGDMDIRRVYQIEFCILDALRLYWVRHTWNEAHKRVIVQLSSVVMTQARRNNLEKLTWLITMTGGI